MLSPPAEPPGARLALLQAVAEFEADLDRIRADESRDLEDLIEIVDEIVDVESPRAASLAEAIVRQEHAAERLRDIRADCEWRLQRAFNRLKRALS
jgi:hypothetical protein